MLTFKPHATLVSSVMTLLQWTIINAASCYKMLICFIVGPSFLVKCPIFAVRCSQKSLSENQTKSKSPQSWWRPLQLQILLHAYHIHYKFSYCTKKKKCPKLPRSILTLASFPALQVTESWVGPGNEAILTHAVRPTWLPSQIPADIDD